MASVMVCDTEMWGFIADKLTNVGQVKGKSTRVGSVTDASHLSVVRSGWQGVDSRLAMSKSRTTTTECVTGLYLRIEPV